MQSEPHPIGPRVLALRAEYARTHPRVRTPRATLEELPTPDVGEFAQCYCGAHVLLFEDGHKEEYSPRPRPHACPEPWKEQWRFVQGPPVQRVAAPIAAVMKPPPASPRRTVEIPD